MCTVCTAAARGDEASLAAMQQQLDSDALRAHALRLIDRIISVHDGNLDLASLCKLVWESAEAEKKAANAAAAASAAAEERRRKSAELEQAAAAKLAKEVNRTLIVLRLRALHTHLAAVVLLAYHGVFLVTHAGGKSSREGGARGSREGAQGGHGSSSSCSQGSERDGKSC